MVRRFAQPLGIELPKWEGRVIETKKGVVRLLPIAERAKQLFGEDGAQAIATRLEQEAALGPNPLQGMLFPEMEATPKVRGRAARAGGRMGSMFRIRASPPPARPRLSTVSTPPCSSRPAAAPTRCARCSRPSRSAVPNSFASPTPSRPSIRRAARRSGCSTRCCWQYRDECLGHGHRASRGVAGLGRAGVAVVCRHVPKHGVALVGQGDAGPWTPERDDIEFEGGFVRRFASEVASGDVFLLRTGLATIAALGLVAGEYLYVNAFDDVNGWDLQHARRVRWCRLPAQHVFAGSAFGANPPRCSRVWSQEVGRIC